MEEYSFSGNLIFQHLIICSLSVLKRIRVCLSEYGHYSYCQLIITLSNNDVDCEVPFPIGGLGRNCFSPEREKYVQKL